MVSKQVLGILFLIGILGISAIALPQAQKAIFQVQGQTFKSGDICAGQETSSINMIGANQWGSLDCNKLVGDMDVKLTKGSGFVTVIDKTTLKYDFRNKCKNKNAISKAGLVKYSLKPGVYTIIFDVKNSDGKIVDYPVSNSLQFNAIDCGNPVNCGLYEKEENGVCVKTACTDGTNIGKCSITQIGKVCSITTKTLEWDASRCGCPSGMKVSGSQCIAEEGKCSDGTLKNSCSADQPKYCDQNINLVEKADLCNCKPGFKVSGTTCVEDSRTCEDGTKVGDCSTAEKGKLCDFDGRLKIREEECGCLEGSKLNEQTGLCESPLEFQCVDLTEKGQCSTETIGKYCNEELVLVDKSSLCGCEIGYSPSGDKCILTGPVCKNSAGILCDYDNFTLSLIAVFATLGIIAGGMFFQKGKRRKR